MRRPPPLHRRDFLRALGAGLLVGCDPAHPYTIPPAPPGLEGPPPRPPAPPPTVEAPAIVTSDRARPRIPYGVQSGDVTSRSAIVWSRTDRPARLFVEWSTHESLNDARVVRGPVTTDAADFTARVDLVDLPPAQPIFYRAWFEDPESSRVRSEPIGGRLRTAPEDRRDVVFTWGGDTAGQGWGINLDWGGMKIYEAMRRIEPHFFIHCGDLIYADSPILPEVKLVDGSIWKNLTTPEKSKVAETLAEFRGNYAYNLLDANVRRFNAEVASLVMWDDHEIHNNWYPGQILEDPRYTEKNASLLAKRARRAMLEYTPIRPNADEEGRIYRSFRHGPLLEVFLLDERTYRGPNTDNRQREPGAETAFLGAAQLRWLKEGLARSTATWKVIATDMPLGLIVGDGVRGGLKQFEAWANGGGPPLGRELELADLLGFVKQRKIKNLVWFTADVHYAAAHRYHPSRASFRGFDPFWEFVAGPLHASTYGPNALDPTFGPEVVWKSPPSGRRLRTPADGGQYFGVVRIDGASEAMTVALHDLHGTKLHQEQLAPQR